MRATPLQTKLRHERLSVSTAEVFTLCPPCRLRVIPARRGFGTALRRRGASKCRFQVQGCTVVAPERHHTLYRSELGYRTDFTEQYSLLEVIGKGNFGTVWLAASRQDISHQVAVKVIGKSRKDRSHDESLECIRREVAMWGCLSGDSRYVAELLGLYEDGQNVYLVQQLCQGGDLSVALKEGPLPETCCAAIMWCVLSAIRDCHDHDLALIDVKPQNFLLTAASASGQEQGHGGCDVRHLRLEDQMGPGPGGPCVVACDFGCSLPCTELVRGAKRAGSPVFFAPEQFTSSYGLVVDEWAAGVMLYLLLSGKYPFWDCKREELDKTLPVYQVMLAVCSAPIAFGGSEWRGTSREARDFVSHLLDRNPATRLKADQALQHPWFARCMRTTGGGGNGSEAAAASTRATARPPPQNAGTTSSRAGTDEPTAQPRREQAAGGVRPAAPSAVGCGAPAVAGQTRMGCYCSSNIVPLLSPSQYGPLPVGMAASVAASSVAAASAVASMAMLHGSDDDDPSARTVEDLH